jgi:hypothetical protein
LGYFLQIFDALKSLRREWSIDREINEKIEKGLPLDSLSNKETAEFQGFKLAENWWLESFLKKINIPYVAAYFLFYLVIIIPMIFFIFTFNSEFWGQHQLFYMIRGVLFYPIPLILLHQSYYLIKKLKNSFNEYYFHRDIFCAPMTIETIAKDVVENDKNYRKYFLKPLSFRTTQLAMDVSYNKYYMLGIGIVLGLIGASIADVNHGQVDISTVENHELYPAFEAYHKIMVFIVWWIVGVLLWTSFSCFFLGLHCCKYVFDFFPQKPLADYFKPIYDVMARFWKIGSYVLAAQIPAIFFEIKLVESYSGENEALVHAKTDFFISLLGVFFPLVLIGSIIGIYIIQRSMQRTKQRKMFISENRLRKIKKLERQEKGEQYASQLSAISNEYKDLVNNLDTPITPRNSMTLAATIAGPPTTAVFALIGLGVTRDDFIRVKDTVVDLFGKEAQAILGLFQ